MSRESYAGLQVPTAGKTDIPYADQRALGQKYLKHGMEAYCGTVTGTGALITVSGLPFDPAIVELWKVTGTGAPIHMKKFPQLADDDSMKVIAAGTMTLDAAGGITLGTKQFTIGTDADINENTVPIHWIAYGFRDLGGSL